MNKENGAVKEAKASRVGILYSLSRVLKLVGIDQFCHSFEFLKNKNQKESLVNLFLSYKPFIRLFDARLFSSIFLRNLRSVRGGNGTTLEILALLAIPISMHCSLIGRESSQKRLIDLARLIDGGGEKIEEPAIDSFQLSCSVSPSMKSLYAGEDLKKTHHHYDSDSTERDISINLGGWKRRQNPTCDIKNMRHFYRFFESYKEFLDRRDRDCVFPYAEEILDSWEIQRDLRYFLPNPSSIVEKGFNRNLSSYRNPRWVLRWLRFSSQENGLESPISIYSQTRNKSMGDRLIGSLLPLKESNPISIRAGGVDQNSKEPREASRIEGDLLPNTILWNRFGFRDKKRVDPKKNLLINCGTFLGTPGVVNRDRKSTTCPIRSKERGSILPRGPLVKWKGLTPLCSIYMLLLRDSFCALANEYFLRVQYRLDGWTEGKESASVVGITIGKELLKWGGNAERLLIERIPFGIDEYVNAESSVCRDIGTAIDFSFPSPGIIFAEFKYNLGASIRGVSRWRDKFLTSHIGTTIEATGRNEKYSHQSINLSFLYKCVFYRIICRVLVNAIDYLVDEVNDPDHKWINSLFGFQSFDIYRKVSVFKRIIEEKDHLFVDSGLLMDEGSIGSSIPLRNTVDPLPIGSSGIGSIQAFFDNYITAKQNWNLFPSNWSCQEELQVGFEGHFLDRVFKWDFLNQSHLSLSNRAERDSLQKFGIMRVRDFATKKHGGSYSNLLGDFCMGSSNKVGSCFGIGSFGMGGIVSLIQYHVSDLLLPSTLQKTERETNNYILTTIQITLSDSDKFVTFSLLTHSNRRFNLILTLRRLLSTPGSFSHEGRDLSSFSRNSNRNSPKRALGNDKLLTDWQFQTHATNLSSDQVNSNKSIGGSGSVSGFVENRLDQHDSLIRSFWELKELKTLYWLERISLYHIGTASESLTKLLAKVLHEDVKLAKYVEEKLVCASHPICLRDFLNDLNDYKISWIFWKDNISEKWRLLGEYIPWFFTPTWWKYFHDLIRNTYPELILKMSDDSHYHIPGIAKRVAETTDGARSYLLGRLALRFRNESIIDILSKLDSFLTEEINNQAKDSYSGWSTILKFPNISIPSQLALSILLVLASFKSMWPVVSGFGSLYLWKRFATIGYSKDPMRRSYLGKVMYYPPIIGQMGTRDPLIHSLKRVFNYINNIFFYSLVKNGLDLWMLRRESPDTLRVNKELLTQYLVTNETIFKYGSRFSFHSLSSEPNCGLPPGGSILLPYLHRIRQNNLWNYKIRKSDPAEKWVIFAPGRNIPVPASIKPRGIPHAPYSDLPVSLQSELLSSEGIPLIGPMETGRSHLIRDIASDSYSPLVKPPIPKLLHNRSYFNTERGNFISKESVYRVSLVFEMAKEMSPRVIWIQDIHRLNAHRSYHESEADPRFLPCLVPKSIHNGRRNCCIRNNLVIASTHVPAEVDPALIAPNRLNKLINFRRSNKRQRQKELPILLSVKGFNIQADPSLFEGTGFGTTGYSKRDLFFFAQGALLIGIYRKSELVCSDTVEFTLHRQHSAVIYMGNEIEYRPYDILSHRIGKAILKNGLIDTSPADPFWIGRNTLKRRFYHLSNWYLESSITESTVTESTLFTHILGLLTGLAARDSWFEMNMIGGDNPIVIDKILENDFHLACGILENFFRDFSRPEICRNDNQFGNGLYFYSPTKPWYSSGMICASYFPQFLETGELSEIRTDFGMKQSSGTDSSSGEVPREMTWSPRIWHFSFMRSDIYESIRLLSEFEDWRASLRLHPNYHRSLQQDSPWDSGGDSQFDPYEKRGYHLSHTRTLNRLRQKQTRRLEDRLETTSLRDQFPELGLSESSSSYETQWNRLNEPVLFVGGRFTWDPMFLFQPDSSPSFPRRSFLAKQELVRRLYVTYGLKREREKHFPNEGIKNLFLYRGYNRKSITIESPAKQLENAPSDKDGNFEYVKETWFMHTYLQYPLVSLPVHLYQNIVGENLKERFVRLRLLIHRDRWMKRNRSQLKDFFIYNMLFESYQYLFNPFWFDRTRLDRRTKQLLNGRPFLYKQLLHALSSSNL
nr:ycf2 [Schizaea tenella]UTS56973.1 ycf2 [Schizaea tenella]